MARAEAARHDSPDPALARWLSRNQGDTKSASILVTVAKRHVPRGDAPGIYVLQE
ncbi:hypothetical protein SAMN05421666_1342 [Roseovarius nanhaiticus]|uniref:Uncharacterized protein n=1 Tax=Roseovarius nanhaiticus TaxID=573024 RepID=A0A1N7FST9_9RHOB|nr:hypothetical protein [Roseovarius nanhaiticus]SEK46272.1 hypothetical protein SAMN05216208_0794 [Roseovarius nanhaiticus]SIS03422.1 hypothetical protein SAMN05421666_1342 [Roseovarius nanhaiticus]